MSSVLGVAQIFVDTELAICLSLPSVSQANQGGLALRYLVLVDYVQVQQFLFELVSCVLVDEAVVRLQFGVQSCGQLVFQCGFRFICLGLCIY